MDRTLTLPIDARFARPLVSPADVREVRAVFGAFSIVASQLVLLALFGMACVG